MDGDDVSDKVIQLKIEDINDQISFGWKRQLDLCWKEAMVIFCNFQANFHHIHAREGFFWQSHGDHYMLDQCIQRLLYKSMVSS